MKKNGTPNPNLSLYLDARSAAIGLAQTVRETLRSPPDPAARYLERISDEFATYPAAAPSEAPPSPSFFAHYLDTLGKKIHLLQENGGAQKALLAVHGEIGPLTWGLLNSEEPILALSRQLAELAHSRILKEGGTYLELGAGLGIFTRQLKLPARSRYIATDAKEEFRALHPSPRTYGVQDLDSKFPFRELDAVFASMSLHCAASLEHTLREIHSALRPGGILAFCEGMPRVGGPSGNEQNVLNVVFALYDGWFNRGGFLDRPRWKEALEKSGFEVLEVLKVELGSVDLGGTFLCRKA